MDPNTNLQQQRRLAAEILRLRDARKPDEFRICNLADELSELVQALDGWISRGGFLPDAWQQ